MQAPVTRPLMSPAPPSRARGAGRRLFLADPRPPRGRPGTARDSPVPSFHGTGALLPAPNAGTNWETRTERGTTGCGWGLPFLRCPVTYDSPTRPPQATSHWSEPPAAPTPAVPGPRPAVPARCLAVLAPRLAVPARCLAVPARCLAVLAPCLAVPPTLKVSGSLDRCPPVCNFS